MKILFLRNKISYSISADIEKLRTWLKSAGLEPEIVLKDVALPLSFKNFGVFSGRELFGCNGIKQQIRDEALVPLFKYDIVYFCYDDPKTQTSLASWTYPSDLSGSAFCEIVYTPQFVGLNGDVLIHESLHAMNRLLMFKGKYVTDTLDSGTPNDAMLAIYKPLFPIMLKDYSIWTKIARVKEEIAYFTALLGLKKKQEIELMILRVAYEEGVDGKVLLAVAKAESGLDSNAKNVNNDEKRTTDWGIMQLNDYWYKDIVFKEVTKDPEMSVRIAARRFKQGFMSDWSCVKNGSYKKYL